jgi:hypothetical protein
LVRVSQDPLSPFGYRVPLYAKPTAAERSLIIGLGAATIVALIIGGPLLGTAGWAGLTVGLLCLFGIVAFTIVLRTGSWLEGTTLVIRGGFSRRERDLATAAVRLAADPVTGLPVLITEEAGRAPVRLLLREPGGRVAAPLPPAKLHALAGAIMAGGRTDPAGQQAAGQLMALADGQAISRPPRGLAPPAPHWAVARGHASLGNDELDAARP